MAWTVREKVDSSGFCLGFESVSFKTSGILDVGSCTLIFEFQPSEVSWPVKAAKFFALSWWNWWKTSVSVFLLDRKGVSISASLGALAMTPGWSSWWHGHGRWWRCCWGACRRAWPGNRLKLEVLLLKCWVGPGESSLTIFCLQFLWKVLPKWKRTSTKSECLPQYVWIQSACLFCAMLLESRSHNWQQNPSGLCSNRAKGNYASRWAVVHLGPQSPRKPGSTWGQNRMGRFHHWLVNDGLPNGLTITGMIGWSGWSLW